MNTETPTLRQRALELYKPPFRYDPLGGYVWDAENHMMADNHIELEHDGAAVRVRGWGRISYMPDAEELQDEIGLIIAEALNARWGDTSLEAQREKAEKFAHVERCMEMLQTEEFEGGVWTACTLLLIGSAHKLNSARSVVTQEGVTIEDAEVGNWRVTVEKLDDLMNDSRDRLEQALELAANRFARMALEFDGQRNRDIAATYEADARETLRAVRGEQ